MKRYELIAAAGLSLLLGCAHLSTLKEKAGHDLDCPSNQVKILNDGKTRDVEACGKHATYHWTGAHWVAQDKTDTPAEEKAAASPAASSTPAPAMSESERKAAARAAYLEGAALQEKGDCVQALPRFAAAEKLFEAATHELRIAQCQAATGKLVEAQESYETLVHKNLSTAPDAFKQAQDTARKELPTLQPRIPTLRVQITQAGSSPKDVAVQVNGTRMPNELINIARPVNPGTYKVTASATGYKAAPVDVQLGEGDAKTVDMKLTR
jgi:hypothetical protein